MQDDDNMEFEWTGNSQNGDSFGNCWNQWDFNNQKSGNSHRMQYGNCGRSQRHPKTKYDEDKMEFEWTGRNMTQNLNQVSQKRSPKTSMDRYTPKYHFIAPKSVRRSTFKVTKPKGNNENPIKRFKVTDNLGHWTGGYCFYAEIAGGLKTARGGYNKFSFPNIKPFAPGPFSVIVDYIVYASTELRNGCRKFDFKILQKGCVELNYHNLGKPLRMQNGAKYNGTDCVDFATYNSALHTIGYCPSKQEAKKLEFVLCCHYHRVPVLRRDGTLELCLRHYAPSSGKKRAPRVFLTKFNVYIQQQGIVRKCCECDYPWRVNQHDKNRPTEKVPQNHVLPSCKEFAYNLPLPPGINPFAVGGLALGGTQTQQGRGANIPNFFFTGNVGSA